MREDQRQARHDMARILDSVRDVIVAVARLEKKPVEMDTPQETSERDRIPPPPPPPVPPPPSPVVQLAVGQYRMPALGMTIPFQGGPTSDQAEQVRPRQYTIGESSGAQDSGSQQRERWDVDRFLKNGGKLFFGGTDPEVAIEWFDNTEGVLEHMGCPLELWVRVASGAIQSAGRVWWKSSHSTYLQRKLLEIVTWEEFREVFYTKFFSFTIREKKKAEFAALTQENMSVAEYEARFLTLERFAPGTFANERERAARFVAGLRLSLRSSVAMFACATLIETVMRVLEGENAHEQHHLRQGNRQQGQPRRQRSHGQDHQQGSQQRRRTDDRVVVHAAEGQQISSRPRPFCSSTRESSRPGHPDTDLRHLPAEASRRVSERHRCMLQVWVARA